MNSHDISVIRSLALATASVIVVMAGHTPLLHAADEGIPPGRIAQAVRRPGPRPIQPGPVVNPPRPTVAGQQSQTLSFGGGGKFVFIVPVRGAGEVTAKASWSGKIRSAQAFLFGGDQKTPVASVKDKRGLSLTYKATKPGTMELHLVFEGAGPDISGRVTVSWPGQEGAKLVWANAFAPDPKVRALLDKKIGRLDGLLQGARPTSPVEMKLKSRLGADRKFRANVEALTGAYAGRMRAIDTAPAGSISTLVTQQHSQMEVVSNVKKWAKEHGSQIPELTTAAIGTSPPSYVDTSGEGIGELMTISFMQLICGRECKYDYQNDDEPYFMIGIVRPAGVEGYVSKAFKDVDTGDKRPVMGMADEQIWQGRIKETSYFCVQMMEHDRGDTSEILDNYLAALEAGTEEFTSGAQGDFNAAVCILLPLFGGVVSHLANDDLLGALQVHEITPANVTDWRDHRFERTGSWYLPCFQFYGSGATKEARYWLIFKFH